MENVFVEWIWKERVFLVRDNIWKMPTDIVSFAVSTGLGISVVAGILSGVCYVLAHGSPKKKSNRKSKSNLYCDVCGEYFRSIDHILGGDKAVSCFKCQKKVCQKRCANLDKEQNGWICKNCLRPPESWFQGILYAIQPHKKETVVENMEPSETKGSDGIQKSREEVQDFIEKLVNSMLGQNIDDANVTNMYNDEHYLPLTGQQSPCTAHAALKQLIEKLLQDVLNLPQFQRPEPGAILPPDLNNKTYEDLLATAILNKVISNSQNAHPSSSAASVSSRISNSSHIKEEKEYFFGEQTLGTKWRHPDMETTSVSSLEDWLQSDSSFGSKKYVDRVTLTIKQDIEEVSLASESDNEDEEDDTEYFRTKTSLWDDDEPNWFLQKRTFQGAHSPVPVPMLVPNPTTEAKVLIGDKEIDETSDLSDAGSDFGDAEIVPTRHSLLINSKTIIGGKNILQNGAKEGESESESSADSGVKEVDRGQSVYDDSEFTDRAEGGSQGGFEQPLSFVSRADITLDDDNVEDASVMSVYSNTEQEAEYTEKYASLPRTIEKKPEPPPRYLFQKNKSESTTNQTQSNDSSEDRENEDIKLVQMHFSGTYSRREKEKWKNAVEMKNNPYSKENIEKRIKRSNSGVGSLFGPDYYAKLASSPSGTKAKSLEAKGLIWPPPLQNNEDIITNINGVSTPEEKNEEAIPEKHISKTYISKENNQDSFKAVPVIIQPEGDSLTLDFNQIPPKSPNTSSEMASLTSDSDLSYVHVYNVENAEISKKPKEHPLETSTPDRFKFVKAPNTSGKRFVNTMPLKRHKSETDLLDESFYTPPKVLGKKKDNTLISKIYLDPQVRSFALSNRQQLPVNHVIPTFRTQLSNPEIVLDYKAYHSDDGVTLMNNKNHTVYSSEEDLLSSNSSKNDTMVLTAKMSLSSEDDQYSEKSTSFNSGPKKQIYSSSEDLLSIDEMDSPKKKDNTLISKIYQQHNVRKYALAKRPHLHLQDDFRKTERSFSSDDDVFHKSPVVVTQKDVPEVRTQLEMAVIKGESYKNGNDDENDPGVEEIAKRKIVHNLLGKFSGSQTNLLKSGSREDINGEDITYSVKDLRKKFEIKQAKSNVVSSLTARSLSKQMKQNLRH